MCYIIVFFLFQANNPIFPGNDADVDHLIGYYHQQMYTQTEIRAFLILRHGRDISKTHLRRAIRALGLRRNNNEATDIEIMEGIHKIHEAGFTEAGYRVIWRFLNVNLGVRATQSTVQRIVKMLDPEGVRLRKAHRLRRRVYKNDGPNCIVHIDGYDKLKPYGFSIHGAIDGFSRKLLWLRILRSNKNPYSISRLYFDMVLEQGRVPKVIRCDAGTENVVVNEIQSVLRSDHADIREGGHSYIVNRSTANQRIEAFWSFLKRIFTAKWKNRFRDLEQIGLFNTADSDDVENMRMWLTSILQNELDHVKMYWNSHRIRLQRDVELTTGEIPDVMFYQPELFLAHDCSLPLPCTLAELSECAMQLCLEEPPHGCSDDFFERVSFISNIPQRSFEEADTFDDALKMYIATRDLLKSR